jgi:hypothetical protein
METGNDDAAILSPDFDTGRRRGLPFCQACRTRR